MGMHASRCDEPRGDHGDGRANGACEKDCLSAVTGASYLGIYVRRGKGEHSGKEDLSYIRL